MTARARISPRTRFLLGLSGVLLPFFLAAAAAGWLYLLPALIDPLEQIVEGVTQELEPMRELQAALLRMAVAAHRHHMSPSDAVAGRERFAELDGAVVRAFERVRAATLHHRRERELVESARREWERARGPGRAMFAGEPAQGAPSHPLSESFDARIERAALLLAEVHQVAYGEIGELRAAARVARTRSLWVTFAAFAAALAISLYSGAALARSIVSGMRGLRQSAARLARSELSHWAFSDRCDEAVTVTASFGVAAFPLHGATPVALVAAADRALYAAKQAGRDRVVCAT